MLNNPIRLSRSLNMSMDRNSLLSLMAQAMREFLKLSAAEHRDDRNYRRGRKGVIAVPQSCASSTDPSTMTPAHLVRLPGTLPAQATPAHQDDAEVSELQKPGKAICED
jgi:hypothetical protein